MASKPAPATTAPATTAPALLRSRNNRQSGTRINLYSPAAAGAPYTVQCMAHNTTVTAPSRKLAKPHVYTPAAWCPACATIVAAKLAAAKAAVAAGTAAAPVAPVASVPAK